MEELISIIVPVYQSEKWLKRCLDSILSQSYKEIEIIIIDDGSKDGSPLICDEYQKKDSRIKVFHQNNMGAAHARNIGLENAKGQFISFVDSDDWIEKDYIKILYAEIKDRDISICQYKETYSKRVNNKSDLSVECSQLEIFKRMLDPTCNCDDACYGYLWNKMFKRDIIDRYHIRFNEQFVMWEDMLFCVDYVSNISKGKFIYCEMYNYNKENEYSISRIVNSVVMESWDKAVEKIGEILKSKDMYEAVKFNRIMADLYMKTLLAYANEKNIKSFNVGMFNFLNNNKGLLRKRYKIYFKLYCIQPRLLEFVSNMLRV